MPQFMRSRYFFLVPVPLLAAVLLLLMLPWARTAQALSASDLDGPWVLTEMTINDQALTLPDGETYYIIDTASSSLDRDWKLDGMSMIEGQCSLSNVTYRGPAEFTATDQTEIQNAGLNASEISGVMEFTAAPNVTVRLAYRVQPGAGGVMEAVLTRIYQSAAWTLPSGTLYAPRPAGYGQGQIAYQAPAGARMFNSMKWRRP